MCLTWFPNCLFMRTQYITSIGLFYKNCGSCGGESDCEELVGITHARIIRQTKRLPYHVVFNIM